jgi:hypothetical protein
MAFLQGYALEVTLLVGQSPVIGLTHSAILLLMYPAKLPNTSAGCETTWFGKFKKTVCIHDVKANDCTNEPV